MAGRGFHGYVEALPPTPRHATQAPKSRLLQTAAALQNSEPRARPFPHETTLRTQSTRKPWPPECRRRV
eukprot:516036-Heterocapsa_arctica.AAC.1